MNKISENIDGLRLSQRDLNYHVHAASPEVRDQARLRQIIQDDVDFRNQFVGDEKVFRAVIKDETALVKISPKLDFEFLLRHYRHPLSGELDRPPDSIKESILMNMRPRVAAITD